MRNTSRLVILKEGNKIKLQFTEMAHLHVLIPRSLDRALRELIARKYGEFRKGLLSWEVTQALTYWVSLHTQKHTKSADLIINQVNPVPKVFIVYRQVKDYILRKHGYPVQQISYDELREAISSIRGSDPRTIKKWIRIFMESKLIKLIAPHVYELT
ncbi:MAG: hypothetical protein DRI26_00095 [Chloroflexi bacterium]|nr:MAG: hypothetical protein DRI26_00095 [Chloroflexota bacterium]